MNDMKEKCLNNLEDLIVELHGGAAPDDVSSSRLLTLYESVVEKPFPLPFIFVGRPRFKRLLWRPGDFRPEIRNILERELAAAWRNMLETEEAPAEEAPPREDDPAGKGPGGAVNGDADDVKQEAAAPGIRKKAPGADPDPAAFPGFIAREDLFDRFIGWVAALLA